MKLMCKGTELFADTQIETAALLDHFIVRPLRCEKLERTGVLLEVG